MQIWNLIHKSFWSFIGLLVFNIAQAETLTGRVVSVIDGDTIRVVDLQKRQHKIRLVGIDAPEKTQPYGNFCRNVLHEVLRDKMVDVIWKNTDQYGRILGTVVLDGGNVNLRMIMDGCAWFYRKCEEELPEHIRDLYQEEEKNAFLNERNLWKDKTPIPPWQYRYEQRNRQ